jgi:hypothetical protein
MGGIEAEFILEMLKESLIANVNIVPLKLRLNLRIST